MQRRVKDGDLPQEFIEDEPTKVEKATALNELTGIKVSGYTPGSEKLPVTKQISKYRMKQGKWKYIYQKPLNARSKIKADLLSLGLTQKAANTFCHPNSKIAKTVTGGYSHLTKDPQMVSRIESNVDEMVQEAVKIIKRSATKAAQNYADAVEDGNLKASGKVLDLCGGFSRQSDINLNISFGQWLKSVQSDRAIDVTPNKDD